MTAAQTSSQKFDYEGFEIHVTPAAAEDGSNRYGYTAYVCHPGANPAVPGHTVSFHSDFSETFRSEQDAIEEAAHVGRSVVDGTHPDLSVLSLVTHGF
jgi:hypothetical protein